MQYIYKIISLPFRDFKLLKLERKYKRRLRKPCRDCWWSIADWSTLPPHKLEEKTLRYIQEYKCEYLRELELWKDVLDTLFYRSTGYDYSMNLDYWIYKEESPWRWENAKENIITSKQQDDERRIIPFPHLIISFSLDT